MINTMYIVSLDSYWPGFEVLGHSDGLLLLSASVTLQGRKEQGKLPLMCSQFSLVPRLPNFFRLREGKGGFPYCK